MGFGKDNGPRRPRSGAVPINFSDEDLRHTAEEFLCPGQDDKGVSHRLHFRVTPITERALEVLRDSKRFPYKTVSDIVRHAVMRHIAWLHLIEPTVPKHFLAGLTAVNEVVRDSEIMAAVSETFRKLDATIELHIAAGDEPEAIRVLSMARSQIVKVPDCRWKRNFLNQFSTKYAKLLSVPTGTGTSADGEGAGNVVAIRHG